MATSTLLRPPYDAELISLIPPTPETAFAHRREDIPQHRRFFELTTEAEREKILSDPSVAVTDLRIQGPRGDIALSILASKKPKASGTCRRPGILHLHSGGLTAGNRFTGADLVMEWVKKLDAIAILVEYGRPPEHPFPGPLQDCYASLLWMVENADELGIDLERLMVEGQSAGGGLAAATVLMARDKGGPKLHAQLLSVPMFDDRISSISCQQYPTGGTWNAQASAFSWQCYLGTDAGQEGVSYLASPGRATDLAGLPPAYIDVSSTEAFRDEAVSYATKLWASGVQAELHVWPGGPHAFDVMAPTAALSQLSMRTRTAWVKRTMGR
ncbi:putative alpha/beta hydrolase R526 [Colletotrichum tropicale]|nr:putative alpha/beta hydrolase R526 [Colletotrichum tropicale]